MSNQRILESGRAARRARRARSAALLLVCALLVAGAGADAAGLRSVLGSDADVDASCGTLEPFYGCFIDSIIVSGNTHTKARAILREMATKPGMCLESKLIRRDAGFLRGLGYFASVEIRAEQARPEHCRVVVQVVERPGIFMRWPYPVLNYDFEKGVSYGATWKVKNFRGEAEDLAVSAVMRRDKEHSAGIGWSEPWLFGRRVRFRADAGWYRRIEDPSDTDQEFIKEIRSGGIGVGIPLSRSVVRQLWLKGALSFEGRESRQLVLDPSDGVAPRYLRQNFLSLGAELDYDSRSDRMSPFEGTVLRARARRYTSVHGPEQHYILYGASSFFYLPVGFERSFILALRGDIREGSVPSFYDMRLGGVRDVRGFSDDDFLGRVKLVGTLQYRMRLLSPRVLRLPKIGQFDIAVNGTAFLDTGTLAESVLDLDRSLYYSTGGLGLEIISPFRDVLRLEAATDGSGTPAFYLTAGTEF